MSLQNTLTENDPLEFDFGLCHGEGHTDYHSYRYCRICA